MARNPSSACRRRNCCRWSSVFARPAWTKASACCTSTWVRRSPTWPTAAHGFKEAIRYYGELRNLGLPVDHIDVGGGLGGDYDGYALAYASSINYDMDDYAGVVVGMLKELLRRAEPGYT